MKLSSLFVYQAALLQALEKIICNITAQNHLGAEYLIVELQRSLELLYA